MIYQALNEERLRKLGLPSPYRAEPEPSLFVLILALPVVLGLWLLSKLNITINRA